VWLGEGVAKTTDDWARAAVSGEKIPFSATVTFKKGKNNRGYLVLKQDNPSGLPENEHAIKIPVSF
jgi:hypothetical protein